MHICISVYNYFSMLLFKWYRINNVYEFGLYRIYKNNYIATFCEVSVYLYCVQLQ